MRHASASVALLIFLSTEANAQAPAIEQSAWLNYAVVVNAQDRNSDLRVSQRGTINGIASIQLSGNEDAQLQTSQRGRRNTAVIYQSAWNASSRVAQEGQHGFSGLTNLPTRYSVRETDEGYLSYFMTGGFSLVTLTDQNHTWLSRFGRGR